MLIKPAKRLLGTVKVPGDKSISHRAAMIAAMASGESKIENFSTGADCTSTIHCLRQLGVEIEHSGTSVQVIGVGKTGFKQPDAPLDCGNSGTTMRLLAGILAGQNFESVLTGDFSLRKRPMKRIIEPLRRMGAEIEAETGCAPLRILGRNPLESISYRLPVASAQVKSCVLLAGLNSTGEAAVIEPVQTRDHTERMLRGFGGEIVVAESEEGRRISVSGESTLSGRKIDVPSDISGAVFFMVAAACLDDSTIELPSIGINPTRSEILNVLGDLGVEIEISHQHESCGEPAGRLKVKGWRAPQNSLRITGDRIAGLIDEIPILSVLGTQVVGGIEIRDAAELRTKESDRIAAIVENLRRMGADVEEFEDGLRAGRSKLNGAEIDSFGDHRIAMAFSVAALLANGDTIIRDAECADISFPDFYETLESVVQR